MQWHNFKKISNPGNVRTCVSLNTASKHTCDCGSNSSEKHKLILTKFDCMEHHEEKKATAIHPVLVLGN